MLEIVSQTGLSILDYVTVQEVTKFQIKTREIFGESVADWRTVFLISTRRKSLHRYKKNPQRKHFSDFYI